MGFLSKHGLALCGDTVLITYGSGHHQVVRTCDPNVDGVIEDVLTKHWAREDCKLRSINFKVKSNEGPTEVTISLKDRMRWGVEYSPPVAYGEDAMVYNALNQLFQDARSNRV